MEALISFGHFPSWKEQSTVREMLAAAVAEDRQAESQRRTDQHRCLVSFEHIKQFYFSKRKFGHYNLNPVDVTKQTIIKPSHFYSPSPPIITNSP